MPTTVVDPRYEMETPPTFAGELWPLYNFVFKLRVMHIEINNQPVNLQRTICFAPNNKAVLKSKFSAIKLIKNNK